MLKSYTERNAQVIHKEKCSSQTQKKCGAAMQTVIKETNAGQPSKQSYTERNAEQPCKQS
jgi:hypothetical protein